MQFDNMVLVILMQWYVGFKSTLKLVVLPQFIYFLLGSCQLFFFFYTKN